VFVSNIIEGPIRISWHVSFEILHSQSLALGKPGLFIELLLVLIFQVMNVHVLNYMNLLEETSSM
jgi:hypothetical protein